MTDPAPTETPPVPVAGAKRKAAIGFIYATALMDVISLGIMIPVLPNLVKSLNGGDTALAADWQVVFATVWAIMQFFFSPILGMLSDRFGRRPVLLISIFGLGVDYLFMAFAPTLSWLLVGRALNGITAASFSTSGAYIADIPPPEKRAAAFGLLGSAFGVGFVIGPGIGGFLGEIDLRLPFLVAAGLALANWLYGLLILPESLPPERRVPKFDWKKANPIGSLKLLSSHPDLLGLAGVFFLFQLAHNVLPSVFVLYTGFRYGWSPSDVGLMLMATGVANIVVQAGMVGRLVKAMGERGALLLGLACGALGFLIYGLAPTAHVYWLGLPVFALSGLIGAAGAGLISRRAEPRGQGPPPGAHPRLKGLPRPGGPPPFGPTSPWAGRHDATLHMPGLAILIASALLLLGFILAWKVAKAPDAADNAMIAPEKAAP